MLKGIKTGISITQTTPEAQEKTTAEEQPQTPVAPSEPTITPDVTQMKSNLQMSGSLQQTSLFNHLNRLPLSSENGQNEASNAGISHRDQLLNQQDYLQDPQISLFEETKRKVLDNASTPFLKSLYTGSGNDIVDISYGEHDELVHITVNGKEAWKGTTQEFSKLTIDTGDGNDIVTINVYGAKVVTGSGDDQVLAAGRHGYIDTGAGNDEVVVALDQRDEGKNQIFTGDGSDIVYLSGMSNKIDTGSGDDAVISTGSHNTISTGSGDDYIELRDGIGANRVKTGEGDDQVKGYGMFDVIDGIGPFGPTKE
jgi:hypothetical protein